MIESVKAYPIYKDSGIGWLGAVPQEWRLVRMKSLFAERNDRGFPDEPLLACTQAMGVVRKDRYGARTIEALQHLEGLKMVHVGDFVIGLQSFEAGIEYAHDQGIISPAYTVLRPQDPFTAGYLKWLLKSPGFIDEIALYATGIRQGQSVAYERLGRTVLPQPASAEQAGIARVLDRVDRRVRQYLAARNRVIALLDEQREAIVREAVTRGIDPDVRRKPSGVDRLGAVPAHWELTRVKHATEIRRGKFAHRPRNDPSLYDGPYPFVQTGDVARAGRTITSFRQTLNDRGLAVSKLVPRGTLVMAIAANIGDVAVLDFDACFPDSVVGFTPRPGVDRDFLYYVFVAMRAELLLEAPVNTQGNLNVDRIGSRVVALPPLTEQREIVRTIDKDVSSFEPVITAARTEMGLVREYRARLIEDAVTGKIDLRDVAANLPEEDQEAELRGRMDDLSQSDEPDADGDLDAVQ